MDTIAHRPPTSRRTNREDGVVARRFHELARTSALRWAAIGLLLVLLSALTATTAHAATSNVGDSAVPQTQATGTFVDIVTNPVVAALIVTLALLLLIADLASGGIGIASALAALGFALFFWAHLLAGLAGGGEVALVVVGLALIVLELLVVPGFGVPGLLGLAAVLGGLFMAQVGDAASAAQVQRAAIGVGATLLAVLVGLVVIVRALIRFGAPNALVLEASLGDGEPITERATGGWVRWFGGDDLVLDGSSRSSRLGWEDDPPFLGGRRGITRSALRPSGVAEIDGQRVDVITSGEFIPAGEPIEVIDDTRYRRVVRRVTDPEPPDPNEQTSREGSS